MARQAKKSAPGVARGPRGARRLPYGSARDSIKRAARVLFYGRGLRTGLEEILNFAQASKPTFYHHFAGKAELEQEYFRAQAAELWESFDRIAAKAGSPRQFITRWMDFVRRRTLSGEFAGCPLGNFAVEADSVHSAEIRRVFHLSAEKFEAALVAQGIEPPRARELSPSLFMIYQGCFLLVRATGDRGNFTRATRLMTDLVG